MRPIRFKDVNVVYAENQPEYIPLPAHKVEGPHGQLVMCWSVSWRERLIMLLTGKLWISCLTFRRPLQPLLPGATRESVNG